MRVLILDTAYWGVLESAGAGVDAPDPQALSDISARVYSQRSDYGSAAGFWLREAGHEVTHIIANARAIQLTKLGSSRTGFDVKVSWKFWQAISRSGPLGARLYESSNMAKAMLLDAKGGKFDVIFVLNPNILTPRLARLMKDFTKVLVGQIASPLPPREYFSSYDLMISAHPGQVEFFRSIGLRAEYLPLAIDDSLIPENVRPAGERKIAVSFVGSFGRHHRANLRAIRLIASEVPGFEIYSLSPPWKLRMLGLLPFFKGKAWGSRMMEIYASSKIVFNRHAPVAEGFSVNYRMFEAAAAGAVVLTESSPNLESLFVPGIEVMPYSTPQDAVKIMIGLLGKPDMLTNMGAAGRAAVLERHTSRTRVVELEKLLLQSLHWSKPQE